MGEFDTLGLPGAQKTTAKALRRRETWGTSGIAVSKIPPLIKSLQVVSLFLFIFNSIKMPSYGDSYQIKL
jgi:hypothetical protein